MTEIIKSHIAPPGIYKHVHSGFRIQVDFEEYVPKLPCKKGPEHEIGELVVILVNILGWFALAAILITGIYNVAYYMVPASQEVTIEQAE